MTPYNRIREKRIGLGLAYDDCARTIAAGKDDVVSFEGGNFNALNIDQVKSLLTMLGFWPWSTSPATPEEKSDLVGLIGQIQAVENMQTPAAETAAPQAHIVKKTKQTRRGKEKRPGKGRRDRAAPRNPRPFGKVKRPITLEVIQEMLPAQLKTKTADGNQYRGELVYEYKDKENFLLQIFTGFHPDGRKVEKVSSIRLTVSDYRSGYKVVHAFSGRLPLNSPDVLRALRDYLMIIMGEISRRRQCKFCQGELKLKTIFEEGTWRQLVHARSDMLPIPNRKPMPLVQLWKCAAPECAGAEPITLLPTLYKLRLSQWRPTTGAASYTGATKVQAVAVA